MNLQDKKVLLFGKGWLGCDILRQLLSWDADVTVISESHRYFEPDLRAFTYQKKLPLYIDDYPNHIEDFDICISAYYSRMIPARFYNNLTVGSINIHPSLLPDYKGCSSLTWAMANGEKKTGISFHELTDKFDQGKVYYQEELDIHPYEFQLNLYHRAMYLASECFQKALTNLLNETYLFVSGPEGSYYGRGLPNNGEIVESWPKEKKERYHRAFIHPPFPGPKEKK
jgi:methionyl-tRNA formyltransferase